MFKTEFQAAFPAEIFSGMDEIFNLFRAVIYDDNSDAFPPLRMGQDRVHAWRYIIRIVERGYDNIAKVRRLIAVFRHRQEPLLASEAYCPTN